LGRRNGAALDDLAERQRAIRKRLVSSVQAKKDKSRKEAGERWGQMDESVKGELAVLLVNLSAKLKAETVLATKP
jgi:hypothetical protein